jgi:transcriptional regulator
VPGRTTSRRAWDWFIRGRWSSESCRPGSGGPTGHIQSSTSVFRADARGKNGSVGKLAAMYPFPEFKEGDRDAVIAFVRKYPFAVITGTSGNGRLAATHIPLMVHAIEPELVFRGHVMRQTDHWHAFKENSEVLAVFTGPDAPVLASWQSPAPFGGTWNYMAVHPHGNVSFLPDSDLLENLQALKDRFEESPNHKFDSLPEEYMSRLTPAIECLQIKVEAIDSVFKLSQNRSVEEFDSTVRHLLERGGESALVAEEMFARRGTYFPEADFPGSAG